MDRNCVREQHHAEIPAYLWNVRPSADPAIPLHRFRRRPLDHLHDPLVADRGAIRALPRVRKVLGGLEDLNPPSSVITRL